MKEAVVKNKARALSEAGETLVQKIKKHEFRDLKNIKRFEIEIEPVDLLAWLYAQDHATKMCYLSRDGKFQAAAIGAVDEITNEGDYQIAEIYKQISNQLNNLPAARYYGGICFDPDNTDVNWGDFGGIHFVLPQVEIVRGSDRCTLAVNVKNADETKQSIKILRNINNLKHTAFHPPEIIKREDVPSKLQWCAQIDNILQKIQKGEVEKVVMAREVDLHLSEKADPQVLVMQLSKVIERSSLFSFQSSKGNAFLGASPEILFKRDGNVLKTEAIAGTRMRGCSEDEDRLLVKNLLASTKDKNEQHYVVAMINQQMQMLCHNVKVDPSPQILQTNNDIHLVSRFVGEINAETSDGAIIDALHPTPAVGGTPTDEALNYIREYEHFTRGWYTGAVGYFGIEQSEFSVAIRCALVQEDRLKLFSGAGIVAESFPLAEWEETEYKLRTFLNMFKNYK
ncbi:MAG: isochorismate synthase [Candidatus Omnitrophica bacterium]|nr:isochorismate synthase [Candidatus Omnitrophota bacterium]